MDWISIEPEIQAWTPLERRVLELLNEGNHYFRIAGMLHLSFETVRAIIFNIRKKESVLMGKLTNAEKAAIFRAWKDGASQADLAKQYKVSGASICTLIKRLNKAESEIMQTEDKPEQLEDCENGIPNTPLVPAEIEKEISAIAEKKSKPGIISPEDMQFASAVNAMIAQSRSADAEKKSANAEAWRLPKVVQDAVNRYIHDIEDELEMRERRILELQEELDTYRKLYTELADFRKAYRAKVDAAEVKHEAD